MSCILYNKSSYDLLVTSELFRACCEQVLGHALSQEALSDWLFSSNVAAYQYRYDNIDAAEIVNARRGPVDYRFAEAFATPESLNNPDQVEDVLRGIQYQCAEFSDAADDPRRLAYEKIEAIRQAVIDSETSAERIARHRRAQEARDSIRREQTAAEIEKLRAEYPWATKPDAAANLRKLLRMHFPGTKFSVRRDGNSIDVRWTDGAASAEVRQIADQFRPHAFDSQSDDEESPKSCAWRQVMGCTTYLHVGRRYSTESMLAAAELYNLRHGTAVGVHPDAGFGAALQTDDYHAQEAILEVLAATDLGFTPLSVAA